MIRAILVDDESRATELLTDVLTKYCPDVNIISTCNSVDTAYIDIIRYKPDIIFLDIDMPPDTGFDLLRRMEKVDFEVIFVTAFDHFAIDAIRFSALDYLLKPVKIDELQNAIAKARQRIITQPIRDYSQSSALLQFSEITKLVIKSQKGIDILELKDILYFEANGSYTEFHKIDSERLVSSISFGDYELMFQNKGFYRIHRSYMINLRFVKSLDKTNGEEIIMTNNQRLPLARRRKSEFLELLNS